MWHIASTIPIEIAVTALLLSGLNDFMLHICNTLVAILDYVCAYMCVCN